MSHSRHSLSISLVLLAAALSLSIAACGREDDAPVECTVANEPFDCGPGAVCELGACVASKPEPPPIQPQQPPPSQPPQPPQPPAGCGSHNDCCPFAPGCASGEVQHCEISNGASTGSCKPGCRTHAACSKVGLDSCNGLYQCIKGGKHGDPCDDGYPKVDLDDCRFGYYCCPVLKECIEQCKTPGETCVDTGKKCIAWFTGPKCF